MKTPAFLTCAILLLASCMPLQAGTRITTSPAPSSTKVVIVTDSHKNDKKHKKHKKAKKDKKAKTVVIKVGTKVKKRPANAVVIKYDKHDYWYDNGVYYIECSPSVYEVIRPRVGMVVPDLPRYAEKVIIKGEPFFKFETTLYKQISGKGGIQFQVSGFLD